MALDVAKVRAGIKHLLEVKLGTEVQIATSPDQITPPCILVGMPTVQYHQAFKRGLDVMNIPIYALLPRTHDQSAVDRADAWVSGEGPTSFVEILHSDKTLNGSCQTHQVVDATAEFWPGANGELPAYNWNVEVWA